MSVPGLLSTYAGVMRELRSRGVVRTGNNPVGDYAEHLVSAALGLTPNRNSERGFDAVGPDGHRYEVKSRRLTEHSKPTRFSAIRQLEEDHFDSVVAVLFDEDFLVVRAVMLPIEAVRRLAFFQAHVNGWILPVGDRTWTDSDAIDLTDKLRAVE